MFLGVDIGGTKTAVCLGDYGGNIHEKIQFPTAGPEQTIEKIIHAGKKLLNGRMPTAVGVSCGSPQDSKNGVIQAPPNLPEWVDIPITKLLKDAFDSPVYLENDANACALAEWKYGAGRGTKNMVFLTFGTGLGAGLILNGSLYTGSCDMAGEVGHLRLSKDGPMGHGKVGSFEGFCSGGGIVNLSRLLGGNYISTKEICRAAEAGESLALKIIQESARRLGQGLAILIDLLNPQRIVIGSVFTRAEKLFRPLMEQVIAEESLETNRQICEVVPAQLGELIGDIAAISVAINGWERMKNV